MQDRTLEAERETVEIETKCFEWLEMRCCGVYHRVLTADKARARVGR
jgi:hypothetical protein